MNFYLLTMGSDHYPQDGDKDWIGTFSSRELARNAFTIIIEEPAIFILNGIQYKKPTKPKYLHITTNKVYDWYAIIDLRKWM